MNEHARRAALGALLTLLVGLALAAAPRPTLDNRPAAFFPQTDPRLPTYETFHDTFAADEGVLVRLEGGDPTDLLRLTRELELAASEAPAVERVLGPNAAFPDAVEVLTDPDLGGLSNLEFVGWEFDGPLNHTLHLVDLDAPATTVWIPLTPGTPAERAALLATLTRFRPRAAAQGASITFAGQPIVNLELDRASRLVESESMPLLVVTCVVILLLITRSPRLTLALLAVVGLGVFATEGLLSLTGTPANLIVTIAKPLTFALLVASGLHLVVAFAERRRLGDPAPLAARAAVASKGRACALALCTTAVGFSSLALADVPPIRTFGVLAAAGLLAGLPLLLLLLPQALALLDVTPTQHPSRLSALTERAVSLCARHPVAPLLGGLLVVAAGAYASTHLHTQPHAIRYLSEDHPTRRDYAALEDAGVPLAQVEALITAPESLATDEDTLRAVDAWANHVAELPGVRGVLSYPLILREVGYRTARTPSLPDPSVIEQVIDEKPNMIRPVLSEDGKTLRATLLIDTLDDAQLDTLEADAHALFQAPGCTLTLTGSYYLLLGTQRSLLRVLRDSLWGTALIMQLVLCVALRSFRYGLAGLLPNAIPVACCFTLMGLFGIPLDVGTSMTAAIALGIAVDDTLHVLVAAKDHGLSDAARTTGRAVVISSLVVGLGFLAIVPSEFSPTRNFGILCATAMLAALLADVLVLPACLRLLGLAPQTTTTPSNGST